MKQRFAIFASALLLASLCGCGAQSQATAAPAPTESPAETPAATAAPQTNEETTAAEGDAATEAPEPDTSGTATGDPIVYMTTNLTAEGLVAVYNALDAAPQGRIAVKLSTGEPGSNYLRPELIGDLIATFDDPTIVECNTAYGGQRANTAMHYQVAEDHG